MRLSLDTFFFSMQYRNNSAKTRLGSGACQHDPSDSIPRLLLSPCFSLKQLSDSAELR